MHCPYCQHAESKVIDSRDSEESSVRRRRACLNCERRFTTYERVEDILPAVIKKDGRREVFDRGKVLEGIRKACEKRRISVTAMEKCVDRVLREIQDLGTEEIDSSVIGGKVMDALHALDQVAYVRFASVYRSFKDINEFMKELKGILERERED